jgi:hypothetical protein
MRAYEEIGASRIATRNFQDVDLAALMVARKWVRVGPTAWPTA